MKNILKITLFCLIAIAGLNACTPEGVFYDESAPAAYTFSQVARANKLSTEDNGKFLIGISRTKADEARTISVKFIDTTKSQIPSSIFHLTSTEVSFAAGEYEAFAEITYDFTMISPVKSYLFQVAFDGVTDTIAGAVTKLSVTNSMDLTRLDYEDVGDGSYVSTMFGGSIKASFRKAIGATGVYKIYDLFDNEITLLIDEETANIPAQDIGFSIFTGVTTNTWIWFQTGTYANGVCTFVPVDWKNAYFIDNAFQRGAPIPGNEVFHLPAGSY